MTTPSLKLLNLRNAVRGPFDASFEVRCCNVITGPSGSGKSLLLRMIADLDPNEGQVLLFEKDRQGMPAPEWRRRVCYLAAESGWWADTVAEHMVGDAGPLMAEVGLDPALLGAPVAQLSTGERQRTALVRALVRRPDFLLLDEPTSALDPDSKLLVEAVLTRLKQEGVGLIVVSHDPDQLARIADVQFALSAAGLDHIAR